MLDQHAALWVTGCVTTRTEWQPLDLSASRFGVRATAKALGIVPSMPMISTLFVSAATCVAALAKIAKTRSERVMPIRRSILAPVAVKVTLRSPPYAL